MLPDDAEMLTKNVSSGNKARYGRIDLIPMVVIFGHWGPLMSCTLSGAEAARAFNSDL